MSAPPTAHRAIAKRAQQPRLGATWSLTALAEKLPLRFPADPQVAASPKARYRSAYHPPDPRALAELALDTLSDFELALQLIDFSPLEPSLAAHYQHSRTGQVPYHPVSLFLAICLRRERRLSWRELARLLQSPEGVTWRARFGFAAGCTPSASGLRYFFGVVGPEVVEELCPRFITLLRAAGLCPERSTYPGDSPARGVTVTQDGMLHPARHRHCCQLATDSCFRSLADLQAAAPPPAGSAPLGDPDGAAAPTSGRPCRARACGRPGCACQEPPCQTACARASRLDPDARFIHYAGHTPTTPAADATAPAATRTGTDVFGYRDVVERVIDDRFAVAWTLRSGLYAATTDERTIFRARVQALRRTVPDLLIGEWLDDAGVGFGDCLEAIWELGALRMIDIRADRSDRDPAACLQRGYDGWGRPLCPHGYRLRANGYDAERRRTTYLCAQACEREPRHEGDPVTPVVGCPYREPTTVGFVVHVGRTLPDGSVRLAREIPYGSSTWTARYGRRNLSESRNGQLEGMGLKRLRSYGLERNTKEVQLADFLINLRTLGRLVREATAQARS